jgi:tetratricopeptide (TPR) repeat protein
MSEKVTKTSSADSLGTFLVKNRTILLSVIILLLVIVICAGVVVSIAGKSSANGLEQIDTITYTLTKDAADLTGNELAARQDAALSSLAPYAKKGGIVGVRANMLTADIQFQKKDFENSRTSWLKVASLQKDSYTAPIAYFNAGVCSEELSDNGNAITYYENASKAADFLLANHALFSLGRVKEAKGDFEGAKAAYKKINDDHPSDSWAQLGQSRILALQASGKIQ